MPSGDPDLHHLVHQVTNIAKLLSEHLEQAYVDNTENSSVARRIG